MKGQGTFFECKPYGTCWEPNAGEDAMQYGKRSPKFSPSAANVCRDAGTFSADQFSEDGQNIRGRDHSIGHPRIYWHSMG
jgi:hypothetical protein